MPLNLLHDISSVTGLLTFALLAGFCLYKRHDGTTGLAISAASLATLGYIALQWFYVGSPLSRMAEVVYVMSWIVFLSRILRLETEDGSPAMPSAVRTILWLSLASGILTILSILVDAGGITALRATVYREDSELQFSRPTFVLQLLLVIFGIVLLEQAVRNRPIALLVAQPAHQHWTGEPAAVRARQGRAGNTLSHAATDYRQRACHGSCPRRPSVHHRIAEKPRQSPARQRHACVCVSDRYLSGHRAVPCCPWAGRLLLTVLRQLGAGSVCAPRNRSSDWPGGRIEFSADAPLPASHAGKDLLRVSLRLPGTLASRDPTSEQTISRSHPRSALPAVTERGADGRPWRALSATNQ